MLQSFSKLGSVLSRAEQKSITGGKGECTIQCTWILDPIACKCISPDV